MMSDRGATVCTHKVTCSNAGRSLERSVRDGSVRTTRVARVSGGASRAAPGPCAELLRTARRDDTAARLRAGARQFAALRAPQRRAAPRDVPPHLAARRRFGAHPVGAGAQHDARRGSAGRGVRRRGGAARRHGPAPAARGRPGLRAAGDGAARAGPRAGAQLRSRRVGGPRAQVTQAGGERGPAGGRGRRTAGYGVRAPDHPGVRAAVPRGPGRSRVLALRARLPAAGRQGDLPVGGRTHGHARRPAHVRGVSDGGRGAGGDGAPGGADVVSRPDTPTPRWTGHRGVGVFVAPFTRPPAPSSPPRWPSRPRPTPPPGCPAPACACS